MVAMHKAALESFQAVAAKSFEALEKLAELNLAATKTTMEESAEQFKALLEVKDVKALADFAAGSAQPTAEKMTAYTKHVYEITSDTGSEKAKLIDQQNAESNPPKHAANHAMAHNAPAGREGLVT
ncbi:MAG: phasin family protein, partial [Burkholderiales bacterium]